MAIHQMPQKLLRAICYITSTIKGRELFHPIDQKIDLKLAQGLPIIKRPTLFFAR
jgi:CRISPR/Cas system CSM-associated protein Csm4 (group 5 of RAMP superfamily)